MEKGRKKGAQKGSKKGMKKGGCEQPYCFECLIIL
jgi:hypothetical protein